MKKKLWEKLTKGFCFGDYEPEPLRKSIEGKWQRIKNKKGGWWKIEIREVKGSKKKIEVEGSEEDFVGWYIKNIGTEMPGKCHYCGLEGDIKKTYGKYFTKGNRENCGERLEIDRKDPNKEDSNGKYSESNCVLACYPCNNAKSNVFIDKEFEIIGAIIGALKGKGKTKRIKSMKNNNYIKGLLKKAKPPNSKRRSKNSKKNK